MEGDVAGEGSREVSILSSVSTCLRQAVKLSTGLRGGGSGLCVYNRWYRFRNSIVKIQDSRFKIEYVTSGFSSFRMSSSFALAYR